MHIETLEVAGMYPALYGMRNPVDSWEKGDTKILGNGDVEVGSEDMRVAKNLIRLGDEHCKFLRQIQVWSMVNMPRYWWVEMDTYAFVNKNSCSTMHTIHRKPFTVKDFYVGESEPVEDDEYLLGVIVALNHYREKYLLTKEYKYVILMKRLLPESFLQMRTINTNYAVISRIVHQRWDHRLKEEWLYFVAWAMSLPYAKEFIFGEELYDTVQQRLSEVFGDEEHA